MTAAETATQQSMYAAVVGELTASCVRRATQEQLLLAPGAVGVLAGAGPVVWVHGATDVSALSEVLAQSPDVYEVYVSVAHTDEADALVAAGWDRDEHVVQMVHDGAHLPEVVAGLPAVHELRSGDLADVRDLLRGSGDVEESLLEHSYGDDFFAVAAPVWMFGARDAAGRLVGMVAVRRQGNSAMGFGLTVAADWQGTGLSTALVAAAVEQGMAVGAEFVHAQANEQAVRRLVSCGFTEVGGWQRLTRG